MTLLDRFRGAVGVLLVRVRGARLKSVVGLRLKRRGGVGGGAELILPSRGII